MNRLNAHIKLRLHIDTDAIFGDQCLGLCPRNLERQGVHVNRRDVMHDGPYEGTAINNNLFAQEACSHKGNALGRAAIKPLHQPENDGDDYYRHDKPQDQLANHLPCHVLFLP